LNNYRPISGRISFGRLLLSSASVIEVHYQQQKQQTEKYYQTERLDRLKQNLNSLTEYPRQTNDISFAGYIKEKTGCQIDIFENVQRRVNTVIEQNQIRNKKELNDVGIMLDVYKQHPIDLNKLNILKGLLIEFSNKRVKKSFPDIVPQAKSGLAICGRTNNIHSFWFIAPAIVPPGAILLN
jgi:CRISPR/Cas system CMR-associated protein Cmr1 (group 7 of RAMP superfamily)